MLITVMIIVIRKESVMKYSRQREALLTLLRSTRSHPTADWLYTELRKEFPNISLGTVYRNLGVLAANDDILVLNVCDGKDCFDGFTHNHYHFVCSSCGCVSDVELSFPVDINAEVNKLTGNNVKKHSLFFHGTCQSCINE